MKKCCFIYDPETDKFLARDYRGARGKHVWLNLEEDGLEITIIRCSPFMSIEEYSCSTTETEQFLKDTKDRLLMVPVKIYVDNTNALFEEAFK